MKLYSIILSDPPWAYNFAATKNRKIENHYPTMSIGELCELKVPAADNCVLYLWATAPKLREAFAVMDAWKFEYKSHMVWDKEIIGMGYWFRGQHELLMVGVKGKMSPPASGVRISSVYRERRTRHSAKPAGFRELISSWYPGVPKLEMFSRVAGGGEWDVWGNEAPASVELPSAKC